jgi:chemotaxis protein methyltransferase CheR
MTLARALEPHELQTVCDLVYRESGMRFATTKRDYIERRVATRMKAVGAASVGAYLALLRVAPEEREAVVSAFTVNETYFYREEHQLACLSRDLLPGLAAKRRPGEKIRIWSCPSSTGEEPYSIAIWLLENWALVDAYNVEIIGSDIDAHALAAAREGMYSQRALARLPQAVQDGYFEPSNGHRRQIIQDLRESVTFTRANLMEPASLEAHGRFDVIFCRNVLIYFDDAARIAAAESLFDRLVDGGYLCLGHSESMNRISERFLARRFDDALVYQRPERA